MSYLVLDCTGCGTPRVADASNKTASCPRCATSIRLDEARVHLRTDELAQARDALGQINAQRAGGELQRADPVTGSSPARASTDTPAASDEESQQEQASPRDAIDRALTQARSVSSQRMRVRLTAEGLTEQLGTFTEEEWTEAMQRLGIQRPRAREHLRRLSQASVIAEPEHGVFRYIE